jgi:hypothetical protein
MPSPKRLRGRRWSLAPQSRAQAWHRRDPGNPLDEWPTAQVKALRLMVNCPVTWADWDEELLALELQDKGSSDDVVDFVLYLAHVRSLWASDDPGQLSATCPTL